MFGFFLDGYPSSHFSRPNCRFLDVFSCFWIIFTWTYRRIWLSSGERREAVGAVGVSIFRKVSLFFTGSRLEPRIVAVQSQGSRWSRSKNSITWPTCKILLYKLQPCKVYSYIYIYIYIYIGWYWIQWLPLHWTASLVAFSVTSACPSCWVLFLLIVRSETGSPGSPPMYNKAGHVRVFQHRSSARSAFWHDGDVFRRISGFGSLWNPQPW